MVSGSLIRMIGTRVHRQGVADAANDLSEAVESFKERRTENRKKKDKDDEPAARRVAK